MNESAWTPANLGEVTTESRKRAGADSAFLARTVYGVDRSVGLNPIAKYTANNLEKYKLIDQGMFAYNPMRLNIGSIGYCSQDFQPGLVSPDYVVFECNPKKLDPDFLNYYISGPAWIEWTARAGVGSVRMRIYYKELTRLPILLPPVIEQRAIAEVLSALDDKILLNHHMNATLESMARTVFRQWFVEDEDVGNWEVRTIGEICEFVYGKGLKADGRSAGAIPVYGSNGQIGWHNEYLVKGPGIVVGRKGNPGIVTWAQKDFFPIDTTFYVVPKDKDISLYWLYYELLNQNLPNLGADSAVPGLNRNIAYMSDVIFPVQKTMNEFDDFAKSLFDKINANEEESRSLASLRDSLLPKLMRGEVRVKDVEKKYDRI